MHEVPLNDLHHRLWLLRNAEAYWSAVEAPVLSVLIQPGGCGIKRQSSDNRLMHPTNSMSPRAPP
jgi:hypothetical protein